MRWIFLLVAVVLAALPAGAEMAEPLLESSLVFDGVDDTLNLGLSYNETMGAPYALLFDLHPVTGLGCCGAEIDSVVLGDAVSITYLPASGILVASVEVSSFGTVSTAAFVAPNRSSRILFTALESSGGVEISLVVGGELRDYNLREPAALVAPLSDLYLGSDGEGGEFFKGSIGPLWLLGLAPTEGLRLSRN